VDSTYNRHASVRATAINEDRGTNYGVVRLNLLEHIYETLYIQRIRYGNTPEAEEQWPHAILPYRCVTQVEDSPAIHDGIRLHVQDRSPLYLANAPNGREKTETLDFDAVFVATGYRRDLHEMLLQDARHLMAGGGVQDARWQVQRDYRVLFADKKVSSEAGVWLQGCCESTHGVSLLSAGTAALISVDANQTWAAVERYAALNTCYERRRHGQVDFWKCRGVSRRSRVAVLGRQRAGWRVEGGCWDRVVWWIVQVLDGSRRRPNVFHSCWSLLRRRKEIHAGRLLREDLVACEQSEWRRRGLAGWHG